MGMAAQFSIKFMGKSDPTTPGGVCVLLGAPIGPCRLVEGHLRVDVAMARPRGLAVLGYEIIGDSLHPFRGSTRAAIGLAGPDGMLVAIDNEVERLFYLWNRSAITASLLLERAIRCQ